jgi:hypothetical protein
MLRKNSKCATKQNDHGAKCANENERLNAEKKSKKCENVVYYKFEI